MKFKIPFSGVGVKYTDEEKAVVLEAMGADDTLTQGKYLNEFETKFSVFVGVENCYATSTAASALDLAATLLQLSENDEVICPAHTYNASAYPFAKHGAKLIWSDINPHTWVVDVEQLEKVVTANTKAIVVVHLYGLPADMPAIMSFASSRGIIVIEDCAQAIGAMIDGRRVGSFGHMSVFSFHGHKNISTLGEGGMLCVHDATWSAMIPGLRHNGHRPYEGRSDYDYWIPAMSNVDVDIERVWPSNYCLGEVQCALGARMIDRIDAINQKRRDRFYEFIGAFSNAEQVVFQRIPDRIQSSHHLLPFKYVGKNKSRDAIIRGMAFDFGVQAIVQYYPLNRYPLFQKNGFGLATIPNTDDFFDNMVSLPFHHWLPDDDFYYVVESLKKVITCNED